MMGISDAVKPWVHADSNPFHVRGVIAVRAWRPVVLALCVQTLSVDMFGCVDGHL
jgi:hypothetical protein